MFGVHEVNETLRSFPSPAPPPNPPGAGKDRLTPPEPVLRSLDGVAVAFLGQDGFLGLYWSVCVRVRQGGVGSLPEYMM